MRALWQRYGRDFYSSAGGKGVTESEVEALMDEVTGLKLKRFVGQYIRGTADLPLAKLLASYGIDYTDERKREKSSLGVRTTRDGNDCKLANVY